MKASQQRAKVIAAAAVLLVWTVQTGCGIGDRSGNASARKPVSVLKPTATVPFDRTFDWDPYEGATSYRVVVFTDDGARSFEVHDLTTSSVALAKTVTMPPGSYSWQVTALHDEETLAESPRTPFIVK